MAISARMFLRQHQRVKDGKDHGYWSLVETVRRPDGPRQRTVCYLGELNSSARARWLKTIEVFNEQGERRQLKLFPAEVAPPEDDPNVVRVMLDQVRLERAREFGNCFLGLELWKRLELDQLFAELLDGDRAEVPWSRVAAVLAISRLCAPGSELSVEQRWYPRTALDDLLGIEEGKINDTRLYRCLDRILPHKKKLERHLKQRYGELFAAEFDLLLYDLTSSYVEGQAERNPMLQRGYSRDHRPDCKQVVIALIVNSEGFPISYETFDGNRAEVTTLEVVLRMVERKYGQARRVWVFDRGLISEANLAALRKRNGHYLVATARSQLQKFEQELLAPNWEEVRGEVEVKQVEIPGGEETYILCRSKARREKEKAIRRLFSSRLERALGKLEKRTAAGRLKSRDKIERAVGRIQARYVSVKDLYRIEVDDEDGKARVKWEVIESRRAWREAREGAYLLRTNLKGESPEELWAKYMQLTEVEAAFRALKSEVSIRPLFHQLERRVKAHILVAFLGYALWVTLKHLLRRSGLEQSPAKAMALLSTLQSADIVLPTTDGRQIRLRRITTPVPQQRELLSKLSMPLPERRDFNYECSADSGAA
ncbi:MAG TPA: IS1634 family transposase [Pyrinomonadaceae bacterium]|nr:IS1634 family transposase [Pyrinomonadaceae bacterium]